MGSEICIRYRFVSDKKSTMEKIKHFLCRMGISYVNVENEIHCANRILRFYSFDEYRDSMISGEEMEIIEKDENLELIEVELIKTLNLETLCITPFQGTKKEKIKHMCMRI